MKSAVEGRLSVPDRIAAELGRAAQGVFSSLAAPRLPILIFHRVHAQPDALLSSEPDAARFAALMCFVARVFHVMPMGEALEQLAEGRLARCALVITFDDGYADNAQVALPILERYGLRATIFVSSGFIDGGRMWNDSVIECVRRCAGASLDLSAFGLGSRSVGDLAARRSLIDALLARIKYLPPGERDEAIARLQRACGVDALPENLMMRAQEVRALHARGMEIGAHTRSHPILTALDIHAAEREIAGGRDDLEAMIGARVDVFAYPNGKPGIDYDATHVALLRRLGFRGAVSTAAGVAGSGADPWQLPRFTPWGRPLALWGARLLLAQRRTRFALAAGLPERSDVK